jgi:hypothetical protein
VTEHPTEQWIAQQQILDDHGSSGSKQRAKKVAGERHR